MSAFRSGSIFCITWLTLESEVIKHAFHFLVVKGHELLLEAGI